MAKFLLLPLFAFLASSSFLDDSDDPILTDSEIEAINTAGMWQADKSLIQDMTLGKLRSKYKPEKMPRLPFVENNVIFNETVQFQGIPATFDGRIQWPGCVSSLESEGDCIGNWALAATGVLSDRFCVQKKTKPAISSQYVINCQTRGSGCDGGSADAAWNFLETAGSPANDCSPFQGQTEKCLAGKCAKTAAFSAFKAANVKSVAGIQPMQNAIFTSGPVEACFEMFADLLAYKSGVYVKASGQQVGPYCTKVIGWGAQGATKYWIAQGTFGPKWGQAGFFYYKMGQGGIENAAIAGDPA